ncbi:transglutaminase family protein [Actibacterium sp. 188UL27-1]|uniref:transglutaminase family protein n=1 Tax=Actibacterium sp. 188UL27-1 TaxID=2786961 RepID=UPI00195A110B|nr:transglutaminase family protein [Actibacterium sp. 188UL27-1]MBM7066647.1 transglutaminase family protein [Actibacterium sp. 188UL27-1]
MRLSIHHQTTYSYNTPVSYGLQQLRLVPKSRIGQSVLTWQTQIVGGRKELEFDDHHMNRVMLVSFAPGSEQIVITCEGDVETADTHGVIGKHAGFAPLWIFERTTPLTRPGAKIRSLIKGLSGEDADAARLHTLSARVLEALPYKVGGTDTATAAEEAMGLGSGVCQDHAHIFIAAARLLGHPARYVSGYLMMDDRVQQDASHAWAEVHVDPLGWVGFDVSNGISPDERYVRVATGLDYAEAAPIHGIRFGTSTEESLNVDIQVQQ